MVSAVLNKDMVVEQELNPEIVSIKEQLKYDEASNKLGRMFIAVHIFLYFVSDPDNEPVLRLFDPSHLRNIMI